MVKTRKAVNGRYFDFGAFRIYSVSGAVTANSTVIAGAREGDFVKTSHATGRRTLFVVDNAGKAQFLTNA